MSEPAHRPAALPFALAAVLFDLDNTLFDRDQAFKSWAQAFVHTRLAPQDDLRRREALGLLLSLDGHGYGSRPAMFAALKKAYPMLSESVDSLVEAYYRQLRDYVSLDEGAWRLLDTLDRSGVPFGIVTNGSHRQLHKIEALGLATRATCIFVSEVVGCRKPEAAIFLAAASCLNARPADILFVGDDPEADVWGAHGVGMRTAWLHRERAWPLELSDHCIDLTAGSLDELADIVEMTLFRLRQ